MNINNLKQVLINTLSIQKEQRQQAQKFLEEAELQNGFGISLLELLESIKNNEQEKHIRQAAAVTFKNLVKKNWKDNINEQDKEKIRTNLVNLMCTTTTDVQKQLSEAVRIISESDFPDRWPNLLPDLISKMDPTSHSLSIVNGVLETANSIFKRFRFASQNDEVYAVLKYVLDLFQEPLLILFKKITELSIQKFNENSSNLYELEELLKATRTMLRIFFSLNWLTIPEYFEDHIKEWFELFHGFLTIPPTGPKNSTNYINKYKDEDDEADPLIRIQVAILDNCTIYAKKYDEEFKDLVQLFIQDTWQLLTSIDSNMHSKTKFDLLITNGMSFLSTLVKKNQHKHHFAGKNILEQICSQIIIKNIMLTQNDVENFEDNPVEYLRKDIEGSDTDSRRRVACDFIASLTKFYNNEITQLCNQYLQQLLQDFSSNPTERWISMDAAITLAIALNNRLNTQRDGCTLCSSDTQIIEFLKQFIIPEMQSFKPSSSNGNNNNNNNNNNNEERPIVKADCIKFISTFRGFIPNNLMKQILPLIVNLLDSKFFVVHTYAAACVEKIFTIKDPPKEFPNIYNVGTEAKFLPTVSLFRQSSGLSKESYKKTPRYTKNDLIPILEPLLIKLFNIMDQPNYQENEYLMKTCMRIISVANETILPLTEPILIKIKQILERICNNPSNPTFNHYMFETIACLINIGKTEHVKKFEVALNVTFQKVLEHYVLEFIPYVLQVMAQISELYPGNSIPENYIGIFNGLLNAQLWEHRGNIPALVRLLQVFLIKNSNQLLADENKANQYVNGLLGIFQKLLSLRSTEDLSLKLLCCITCSIKQELYQKYFFNIIDLLLKKLNASKSLKLARQIIVFFSIFVGKFGPNLLINTLEQIAPGCSIQFINEVWAKHAPSITDRIDRKACVVGMSRLICEFLPLIDNLNKNNNETWKLLLNSILSIIFNSKTKQLKNNNNNSVALNEDIVLESLERMAESGHTQQYSRLLFAQRNPQDWFADIKVESAYFAQSLQKLSQQRPNGVVTQALDFSLSNSKENLQVNVQQLLAESNIKLL